MSHAAVKSFDRRGVSCKNARTVQFQAASKNVEWLECRPTIILAANFKVFCYVAVPLGSRSARRHNVKSTK